MLFMENAAPPSFFAAKWIPIIISLLVVSAVSWLYVLYYQRSTGRSWLVSAMVAFSLSVTLLVLVIIPVDVYAISSMKHKDGTFEPWASRNATREHIENTIMTGYYVLYTLVFFVVFFLLPFAYFFYREPKANEERGRPELTARQRARTAVKYSMLFVVLFFVLVALGLLVPFAPPPPVNSTAWHKFEFLVEELETESGEDVISILLYSLSLVGMCAVVGYTGLGLSLWPIRLLRGQESVQEQREDVRQERRRLQLQINTLRDQANYSTFPSWQVDRLNSLEREEAVLGRRETELNEAVGNWMNRCSGFFRPFEVVLGITVLVTGAVTFTALLLSNIDKALHSLGMKTGYILPERQLPNPMDWLLSESDRLYPLDYILYLVLIFTLVGATVSCIQDIGVRVFAVKLYSIRPGRTPAHGLILLVLSLVYVLLALNVLLLSIAPQYTMYGDQHYIKDEVQPDNSVKREVLPCTASAPAGECVLSRMALLLLRFSYKAWIFGAVFYWATWLFLLSVVMGFFIALYRRRPRQGAGLPTEEDRLLDNVDA
ncbi:probable lysosomal cobalamin transporter isoform X1 [Amphibalanus amphitrite]|uniref:probable lysosomal cobalamin transporter isoform X1 n=1 Tax=Amphibalanus amphitrite TaxID=1232801 RepID=UPI001C8FD5A8|nr:probable lysosomal cobalamin transporter isoform X1 [Amphibalanus amphitrite]XP_043191536.1 probable lysosomal cobalamin transporter isoform X1 [Amphibalanus amphitrite]XP_043191537.1 probable lysosomal cobalamin transporter isoform X1 [Amphibalanus amphitrite]XP_043191538.1 probable lysosomal cobalamin transporter isoform X1 [Amphibalanus amphitrite]